MASVNKVILIGNLGGDPNIKEFPNGSIAEFSLATTETWKDRESGEKKSITDWHNVVVRRTALANVVKTYLKKGMSVYVEGKLRTRSWEKEGEKRYITEVLVDELTILTPRQSNEPNTNQNYGQNAVPTPDSHTANNPNNQSFMEDDLPF
jgi:single-strand DNA-binding protein